MIKNSNKLNIGFISTRISGADGVSLEIEKWAEVLDRMGHRSFYCSGENDRPAEFCFHIDEAHFKHPDIMDVNGSLFGGISRSSAVSEKVDMLKSGLKSGIQRFVEKFDIDLLVPENTLSIPMNIPLGLAITEYIAETGIAALAHHHDFFWERDRFTVNAAGDYLGAAFPPVLKNLRHVVINSVASANLAFRKGLTSTVIPNACDFVRRPLMSPESVRQAIRSLAGIASGDPLILQPTRIIPRKWIERSIDLVRQLNMYDPCLVISHQSGDEGEIYRERLQEYADSSGVRLVYLQGVVNRDNVEGACSLQNIFSAADFVTYPSGYEGFGNALLETVYWQRPVMVNRYPIFIADIEPLGFNFCTIDTFITPEVVRKVRALLDDPGMCSEVVRHNYETAAKYYSYENLEKQLLSVMNSF